MIKATVSRLDRGVAVGLAVIFIAAGIIGVVLGVAKDQWLSILVALASIWWGSVWVHVAVKGRRLQFGELLWPFPRR